jgi:hypothetical protein
VEIIKNLTNNVPDSTFNWPSGYTVSSGFSGGGGGPGGYTTGGYNDIPSSEILSAFGINTTTYNAIKNSVGSAGFYMWVYAIQEDVYILYLAWNNKDSSAYFNAKTAVQTQLGGDWLYGSTYEPLSTTGQYINTMQSDSVSVYVSLTPNNQNNQLMISFMYGY